MHDNWAVKQNVVFRVTISTEVFKMRPVCYIPRMYSNVGLLTFIDMSENKKNIGTHNGSESTLGTTYCLNYGL
jgi:hypothetical protein